MRTVSAIDLWCGNKATPLRVGSNLAVCVLFSAVCAIGQATPSGGKQPRAFDVKTPAKMETKVTNRSISRLEPKLADVPEPTYSAQCKAVAKMLKIATRDVCEREAHHVVGRSHGDRKIFAHSTGVKPDTDNALRVLIIGAIHGDEVTAGWLAMQWARWEPPELAGTRFSVRHIPISNPDGVFGPRPSRTNGRGVDLNRNFPTPKWSPEANKWWERMAKRDPRRFPGKTAASELETRVIMDEIRAYRPSVIVAIHAPLGVLDYDGGGLPPERLGSIFLDIVGVYPGSLGHYGSKVHGTPVLTVELPNALKMVSDAETKKMWEDLFVWVKRYAQHDSNTK